MGWARATIDRAMPPERGNRRENSEDVQVDLGRFKSVEDAITQANAAKGEFDGLAKQVVLADAGKLSPLPMFMLSAIARANGLHIAAVHAIETTNPHAAFPLIRAYADVVVITLYVRDNPTYIEAIMTRRRDLKGRKRLSMAGLIAAAAPHAPGVKTVYDELSEGTHFGSIAMWAAWTLSEEAKVRYTTYPRWRRPEIDPLVVAAWLIELCDAFALTVKSMITTYLD